MNDDKTTVDYKVFYEIISEAVADWDKMFKTHSATAIDSCLRDVTRNAVHTFQRLDK